MVVLLLNPKSTYVMKRIAYFLAATLLVAAASCSKEVNPVVDNDQPIVEDNQPVSTVKKISFTAYADNGDETRTSLNADNSVTWAAGEAIYVFDGKAPRKFVSTNTEPAKVVTFEGEADTEATTYYAVSPAATMSGSTITATIPVFQTATVGTFDPKAAISVAVSGTDPNDPTALKFKNAAAAVKFQIQNNDVTKIRLEAINGEKLAGKATITLDSDNIPQIQMVGAESESCVILTGAFVANTDYVIAVAPGTYDGGFRLTLIKADGKFASIANTNSQTLDRSDLMNFGTLPEVTTWKEVVLNQRVDILTASVINVGDSYTAWNDISCTNENHSTAVYAGESMKGSNNTIQIRSSVSEGHHTGIVTTNSGGKVKKVTVEWNSSTTNGRTLEVYGKNTAYDGRFGASDLYEDETAGQLLGSIVKGTSTSLTIEGDYKYIGLRSESGAMYLTSITIEWEKADAAPEDPEVFDPVFEVTNQIPTGGSVPATGGEASFVIHSTLPWTIDAENEAGIPYSSSTDGDYTTVTATFGSISEGSRSLTFTVTTSDGDSEVVTFTQEFTGGGTEQTIFLETFGSSSSNTAVASYNGYTATTSMFTGNGSVSSHYSGSGSVGKNNLAESNLSNGYTGASGLSGCFHSGTANTTATILQISDIDISGCSDLALSFGAFGGSSSHKINVYYKIDNGSETALITNGSITNANWTLLSANIPNTGNSLTLIFKHTPTKAWLIRMDDVKVVGTK